MSAEHNLIVTFDDQRQELRYRLECPNVTDACRSWRECDDCPPGTDYDTLDDADGDYHGVEHGSIRGVWMVPTDDCFLTYHVNSYDDEIARELGITEPGTYRVAHYFEHPDDEYPCLKLAEGARCA